MKHRIQLAAAVISTAATLTITIPAEAQTGRIPSSSWRQRDRTDALGKGTSSPQNFAFEIRFGPYSPEIDENPALPQLAAQAKAEDPGSLASATPYKDTFGAGNTQFYFGLEFDYLPLRIPYVGVLGPGFGWGYTTTSASAPVKDASADGSGSSADSSAASDEETSLTIMPMHLSLVLRADELMRRTGVPVVPYIKFGYGLGWWKASDSNGTSTKKDSTGVSLTDDIHTGLGTTAGYHFALGAMLSLNFLDPRAIASLDQTSGVNHIYIFGEWMKAGLTGISSRPQMYVGTSTVVAGLALDM